MVVLGKDAWLLKAATEVPQMGQCVEPMAVGCVMAV